MILFALLFMTIAGFVIDGGLAIHQRERAADIAEQAARYAANHIDATTLRTNGTVVVDAQSCSTNVQDFARQSGLSSDDIANSACTAANGDTVTVRIRLRYQPVLLNLVTGGRELTVWGTATAQAVQEQ